MKNLDDFSKALIAVGVLFLIGLFIFMFNSNNREYDIKMAQAGLEQCKPHWMNQQVIWVRDCKQIIDK